MHGASRQQTECHGQHRMHISDDIGSSSKQNSTRGRAENGLDNIVNVVHGGNFISEEFDHTQAQ